MNKNNIKMTYPASWWGAMWRDALPSGNGEIGAAVYGGVFEETILVTHSDLWWKSITPTMPDVSDKLPEVRRLLMENKPREADRVVATTMIEKGYNPRTAAPLPLGDIKVIMPAKNAFKNYSRSLNMENGEITVTWMDGSVEYCRNLFVSRADNMIVYKISSNIEGTISAKLYMDLHDKGDASKYTTCLDEYLPKMLETMAEDGFIYYAAQNDDGSDFGAVAKIILKTGKLEFSGAHACVSETDEVLVMVKLFVKDNRIDAWKRLSQELMGVETSYDTLLNRHAVLHGSIFNSMSFDLFSEDHERSTEELLMEAYKGDAPAALIEKMWSFGRYLLISSSKEGGHPCHLYGLWCGEYQGMWAFNMLNENVQMIYWHALSGNMAELLLAVFDYYERLMDDFRENARKLYGCKGIYIPAPTAPDSGLLKHVSPHIIHWTGGAGWLAQHYYDYYLYTGDTEFLINRALPFMKEAAQFYEDFFFLGEDGKYISCPSNSPENTPGNYWDYTGMGSSMETTINATMDFAIAKELLLHLTESAQSVGVYMDEVEKWKEMISRIPEYQINEDGAVKEWMHSYFIDNYHHRHESHLYPVFPGTEVTRENNPELFEKFVTAVKKRLIIGLKEQSGWSMAHMANNYARMGEGNLALECLEIMSRSSVLNNLYTTHNDWRNMGIGVDMPWAPIQLDANMGWCSAINEMLLFSVPGKIHVFPALPEKWRKGRVNGMLARGGIEISLRWDLEEGSFGVSLLSKKSDCRADIILPDMINIARGYEICNRKIKNVELTKDRLLEIELRVFHI